MDKEITSEEKLLKLIRKKNDQENKNDSEKKKSSENTQDEQTKQSNQANYFRYANIFLIFGSVIFVILIINQYITYRNDDTVVSLTTDKNRNSGGDQKKLLPEKKPFETYKVKLSERNIFESLIKKPEPKKFVRPKRQPKRKPKPKSKPKSKPKKAQVNFEAQLRKQIKLVGLVIDQDPKAIVEDRKSKQTLFMSVGDKIGEAELQEIHEDKAIFFYKEQVIEFEPR